MNGKFTGKNHSALTLGKVRFISGKNLLEGTQFEVQKRRGGSKQERVTGEQRPCRKRFKQRQFCTDRGSQELGNYNSHRTW